MKVVRWGLLSTARINRRLIDAIRTSGRGEVLAVASREPARAKSYAKEWEIPMAFGSYEEMLASGEIDVVYISLPNHLHATWTLRALEAGLHVLCEKPFALSLREVDAMIETSQRTGLALAEAFMYRHHPQTRIAGEWVRSGRLGIIRILRGIFSFMLEPKHRIRLVPDYGGGSLWDIGVYPMSFAQYLCGGAPVSVSATQQLGKTGVDESFAGLLKYGNGAMGLISCSFRAPFHTSFEVIGSQGRLALNRPFVGIDESAEFRFHPAEGDSQSIEVPGLNLYLGEVEDMHHVILKGGDPYLSLSETRDHIRTALALHKAARENRTVHIEEIA